MRWIPLAAALLAVAWIAAQALGSPTLATTAVVAGIGGFCLLGGSRRRSRRLQIALVPVLLVLETVLVFLVLHPEHPGGLLLQLALLLFLAPVVPLIYAGTFPRGAEDL